MGLYSITSIGDYGAIGLWKISKSIKEFELKNKLLAKEITALGGVSNEMRKIQILSARLLVNAMIPGIDTGLLLRNAAGKPYFKGLKKKISISHSGEFVANLNSAFLNTKSSNPLIHLASRWAVLARKISSL